jgi:hypothetical protein
MWKHVDYLEDTPVDFFLRDPHREIKYIEADHRDFEEDISGQDDKKKRQGVYWKKYNTSNLGKPSRR